MRIIKFRAWDKSIKKMIFPKLWDSSMPSNWEHWYELQQFTELLDKNGKEIYEGDIMKVNFIHASWWFYSNPKPTGRDGYASSKGICSVDFIGRATKIHFPEKDFWFERYEDLVEKIENYHLYKVVDYKNCEVIGNIFETPELIKA